MNSDFPRIISLLRKERNISQKQAAADLGVSQALLSHYEKGIRECGLDFLVRAADYYNVSCDYLLGRSPEPSGKVTLSLAAHGRRRMIRVHNTGSYIPPEERTKIFDRFYRADASHCRNDGGSGIGLAIAQSIAKLHRGALLVESDRQTGTAFTAILEDVS